MATHPSHALNHIHLILTAWVSDSPMTTDEGIAWLRSLVTLIDMQILLNAQAIYCEDLGNEGVTGLVGLTTSHASFHSWHDVPRPFVNLDIYSCKTFDVSKVIEFVKDTFMMTEYSYLLIDRENGKNEIVDQGRFRCKQ